VSLPHQDGGNFRVEDILGVRAPGLKPGQNDQEINQSKLSIIVYTQNAIVKLTENYAY
jgi:hypothetical protein